MVHGTGIFTYIWLIFIVNVGIYIYIYHTWILWGRENIKNHFETTSKYISWDASRSLPVVTVNGPREHPKELVRHTYTLTNYCNMLIPNMEVDGR